MNNMVLTQPSPDFYTAGGTLEPTDASYIVRAADTKLLAAVKQSKFCYVLTPRQMGKSSLMVRTATSLQESGIVSIIIDLTALDITNTTAEVWYLGQVVAIAEQLGLTEDYTGWWQRQNHLGALQRFTKFLTHVVLKNTTAPVVIFVDEIDSTLSLPFNSDDYFAAIRSLYNKRASDPALKRLTFVLLGVAAPSELIKHAKRTPFNIGTRIELTDFTLEEVQPLLQGLAPDRGIAKEMLEQIYFWTGGHPYLTQKTCLSAAEWAKTKWKRSEAPVIVDVLVKEMFLSKAGQNTDDHLQLIRKRILASKAATQLLQTYRRIRRGGVRDDELDPTLIELKLSGLVKADDGEVLIVRNPIYKRVFDEAWIREALSGREPKLTKEAEFIYDVYISSSSRDRDWVRDYLLPRLKAAGLRIWIDSAEIELGQIWESVIERALAQSRNMLVVLSPASVASSWIETEYTAFLNFKTKDGERLLIPLLLRPIEIPSFLRHFNWVDFTQEKNWESGMQALLKALRAPQLQDSSDYRQPVLSRSTPRSKRYDTAVIRKLLNEAFEDEELTAFIYDYLRPLYDQLHPNTTKSWKIQKIIAYADKKMLFDQLLDNLAREKPLHYRRFESSLEIRG